MQIAVMCLGNMLMQDDGVGLHVGQALVESYDFPPEVDILDAGTMGMALLPDFRTHDIIITVDAVEGSGEKPGTVLRFAPEDILSFDTPPSAHDMRFVDVIEAAKLLGIEVHGHCVGVQVENALPEQLTMELSPAVAAAIPLVMDAVLALLVKELGVRGIRNKQTGEEVLGPQAQ